MKKWFVLDEDKVLPSISTIFIRCRVIVIGPLANLEIVTAAMAAEAGEQLGVSERTVYTMISRYRESGGSLVSLAPIRSNGGRGGKRLPGNVERIISSTILETRIPAGLLEINRTALKLGMELAA